MSAVSFTLNPSVTAYAIADLRESVGWDRQDAELVYESFLYAPYPFYVFDVGLSK